MMAYIKCGSRYCPQLFRQPQGNMRVSIATITVVLLCRLVGARCDESETEQARRVVVQANNTFSTALYQALRNESGNLVLSPLSVKAILSLALVGSGGETARQLAAGLHLPNSRPQVEAGFRALLSSLQSTPTVTLDIANKVYLQQGFRVKDTFRQSAVDNFRSEVQELDFANNTEMSRTSINQWVEEKTHNKIKDLIAEGTLSDSSLMVLVNAIYFKGGWRKPFEEQSTVIEPFHLTSSSSSNVSMMHQSDYFAYTKVQDLNFQAVKLLYRGSTNDRRGRDSTTSMLLLLPDEIDGLGALEASIATLNLTQITHSMSYRKVILSLPRFMVEKTLKLADILKQLGITSLFQEGADLSGITDENVYVSKVVQKVFVEVTEKGTEAAAATFSEAVSSASFTPPEFKCDHPFLFLILDGTTGAILFMGRVAQPN